MSEQPRERIAVPHREEFAVVEQARKRREIRARLRCAPRDGLEDALRRRTPHARRERAPRTFSLAVLDALPCESLLASSETQQARRVETQIRRAGLATVDLGCRCFGRECLPVRVGKTRAVPERLDRGRRERCDATAPDLELRFRLGQPDGATFDRRARVCGESERITATEIAVDELEARDVLVRDEHAAFAIEKSAAVVGHEVRARTKARGLRGPDFVLHDLDLERAHREHGEPEDDDQSERLQATLRYHSRLQSGVRPGNRASNGPRTSAAIADAIATGIALPNAPTKSIVLPAPRASLAIRTKAWKKPAAASVPSVRPSGPDNSNAPRSKSAASKAPRMPVSSTSGGSPLVAARAKAVSRTMSPRSPASARASTTTDKTSAASGMNDPAE